MAVVSTLPSSFTARTVYSPLCCTVGAISVSVCVSLSDLMFAFSGLPSFSHVSFGCGLPTICVFSMMLSPSRTIRLRSGSSTSGASSSAVRTFSGMGSRDSPSRFVATTSYVPSWRFCTPVICSTLKYMFMSDSVWIFTFFELVISVPLNVHTTSGSGTATRQHFSSTLEPSSTHWARGLRENVGGMPSRMSASEDSRDKLRRDRCVASEP